MTPYQLKHESLDTLEWLIRDLREADSSFELKQAVTHLQTARLWVKERITQLDAADDDE